MNELMDEYLIDMEQRAGYTPATVATYRSSIGVFIEWVAGQAGRAMTVADFCAVNVQRFDTARKRLGRAQRSRQTAIAALKSFARWLVDRRQMCTEEQERIQKLRVRITEKATRKWTTDEQVLLFFAACDRISERHGEQHAYREHLARAVLALMAYAGLRRGEVCNLPASSVNLARGRQEVTVRGKGDKVRSVPLNSVAVDCLTAWIANRPLPGDMMFTLPVYGHNGKCPRPVILSPPRLNGILVELCEIIGINYRDLSPHAFRRYAGTKILRAPGGTLRHVADFLGHSDLVTTIKYIGHESHELRALVETMVVPTPPPAPPRVEPQPRKHSEPRKAAFRRP